MTERLLKDSQEYEEHIRSCETKAAVVYIAGYKGLAHPLEICDHWTANWILSLELDGLPLSMSSAPL